MQPHRLSEIWIYPIKSLGGIRLRSSRVLGKGLAFDRRWMLIDEANTFMSQRVNAELALFKLQPSLTGFTISFQEKAIELSYHHDYLPTEIKAKVWDDEVIVHEVSEEHSLWFSAQLGIACKLVCFPEEHDRKVDPRYASENDQVSLADGYPFLIIGQASLDDLNSRLAEPVLMNRFRPNLVFTGGTPYEEDTWSYFTIGKNRFKGVKPCARCVLITVNQESAKKGKEPLATLSIYRKRENKIYFGQNVLTIDHHEIYEGDEIIIHQHN
ncbi:MAG: MOSC domain-containing protein [Cyclobacteriaceae bacterium]|jgi:uncharacterized protein YcbX|nr:MOSC domain-containing protein [Flammeovirgaceae bacterium]